MKVVFFASALALSSLASMPAFAAATFDGVAAPALFSQVTPGGPLGPVVTEGGITFNGGVIVNGSDYGNEQTSNPNLYATTNIFQLANGGSLPGFITGTLSSQSNFIGLDIANGDLASTFSLSLLLIPAFGASH